METTPSGHDDCTICLDTLRDRKTLKCQHYFCRECIDSVFRYKPACPICNTFFGVYRGTQPRGTMTVARGASSLPGFANCGSITIQYAFPGGVQGPEHPNPGIMYGGTSRTAYLPACEEGQKVLRLLQVAFDRRLLFTIGRSVTTGLNNVITWNDIHHKTNVTGGPQQLNPEYLSRVQRELRLKGVTEDDLN
ncbi:unnamed protein product [Merluccius merluccius]